MRKLKLPGFLLGLLSALLLPAPAPALTIFSAGMLTPETISQVPAGFDNLAGAYLVPDATRNSPDPSLHTVWVVPAGGGAPTVFTSGHTDSFLAGLFLPANWGEHAGMYLVVGRDATLLNGIVHYYAGRGAPVLVNSYTSTPFSQAMIAPASFGGDDLTGKLIVAAAQNGGGVHVLSPDGTLGSLAATVPLLQPFGLAFAPAGFGAIDGRLLVSDAVAGTIVSVDHDGVSAPFATIPLLAGQTGLRQMAFAPTDFLLESLGIGGDLLLVSVSGSTVGGGRLGDIVAIDHDGIVVASLRVAGSVDKFDPRGMLFTPEGLLISDASDPILLASADDFRPGRLANVPLPSALLLLVIGLVGLLALRRTRIDPLS